MQVLYVWVCLRVCAHAYACVSTSFMTLPITLRKPLPEKVLVLAAFNHFTMPGSWIFFSLIKLIFIYVYIFPFPQYITPRLTSLYHLIMCHSFSTPLIHSSICNSLSCLITCPYHFSPPHVVAPHAFLKLIFSAPLIRGNCCIFTNWINDVYVIQKSSFILIKMC